MIKGDHVAHVGDIVDDDADDTGIVMPSVASVVEPHVGCLESRRLWMQCR